MQLLKGAAMLSAALVLALLLPAAPAPPPRVRPPVQLAPGRYTLHWGGQAWQLVLAEDGYSRSWQPGDACAWEGRWECRGGRLRVRERIGGSGTEMHWEVTLGRGLDGIADYRGQRVRVKLKRLEANR